jgi:hypothetical protein
MGFDTSLTGAWYNSVPGLYHPIAGAIDVGGDRALTKPVGWD